MDQEISNFLIQKKNAWHDYNIPYEDGLEIEKLIVKGNYTAILEIGTSTGHSGIWLAKAAAKTGGKVITIEIDPSRHQQALRNFKSAGVAHLIDARLGDAMKLIPQLEGSFDFVFSDATWTTQPADGYLRFFQLTEPKLVVGGLYTMHNVTDGYGDDGRFFRHLEKLSAYTTSILATSQAGISVSKRLR